MQRVALAGAVSVGVAVVSVVVVLVVVVLQGHVRRVAHACF